MSTSRGIVSAVLPLAVFFYIGAAYSSPPEVYPQLLRRSEFNVPEWLVPPDTVTIIIWVFVEADCSVGRVVFYEARPRDAENLSVLYWCARRCAMESTWKAATNVGERVDCWTTMQFVYPPPPTLPSVSAFYESLFSE